MPSHRIGTATNLFGSYIINKIYELELAGGNVIIVQGGGQELAGVLHCAGWGPGASRWYYIVQGGGQELAGGITCSAL